MGSFFFFLCIVIIVLIVWLISTYNRLQSSMQEIREGLSNLQAGLKKRQHLSGQIIEIASGYLEHEQVTQLKVAQHQQDMTKMLALAQSFPQLRADATCQQLMQQLESLEDDILKRREGYNSRVKHYNSYRNSFPTVLVAQKLSFGIVSYFDLDDAKFELHTQSFERDDSRVLQELIGSSKKAVGQVASQTVKNLSQGVSQIRQYADDKLSETRELPNAGAPQTEGEQSAGQTGQIKGMAGEADASKPVAPDDDIPIDLETQEKSADNDATDNDATDKRGGAS